MDSCRLEQPRIVEDSTVCAETVERFRSSLLSSPVLKKQIFYIFILFSSLPIFPLVFVPELGIASIIHQGIKRWGRRYCVRKCHYTKCLLNWITLVVVAAGCGLLMLVDYGWVSLLGNVDVKNTLFPELYDCKFYFQAMFVFQQMLDLEATS